LSMPVGFCKGSSTPSPYPTKMESPHRH
jgi:hypothetical protein